MTARRQLANHSRVLRYRFATVGFVFGILGCGRPVGTNSHSFETDHLRIVTPVIKPTQNVIEGDRVECDFSLTSKATEVIEIDKIEAGCGCMEVVAKSAATQDGNCLKPGQTRLWSATINTRARAGNSIFPIDFTYRIGSVRHSIKLPIQIAIHPGVFCQIPTIVINGLKPTDSFRTEAVLLRDVPESLVSIESIECTDRYIAVDWSPLQSAGMAGSKHSTDEPYNR